MAFYWAGYFGELGGVGHFLFFFIIALLLRYQPVFWGGLLELSYLDA